MAPILRQTGSRVLRHGEVRRDSSGKGRLRRRSPITSFQLLVGGILLVVLLLAVVFSFLRDGKPLCYTIREIVPLPHVKATRPTDVNNCGQVVGAIEILGARDLANAFIWSATDGMTDLGIRVDGDAENAVRINDFGQIAIPAIVSSSDGEHGEERRALLRLPNGEIVDLGGRSRMGAFLLNNSGEAAFCRNEGFREDVVFWSSAGGETVIEEESSPSILLRDLNNNGQLLVGKMRQQTGWEAHIWDRRGGFQIVEAPVESDCWFSGRALNDRGEIAGFVVREEEGFEFLPEVLRGGELHELGTLGGAHSAPCDINNRCQAIGDSGTRREWWLLSSRSLFSSRNTRLRNTWQKIEDRFFAQAKYELRWGVPFLWEGNRMWNLNDLLPDDSNWSLRDAKAINDVGQIVGTGAHDGQARAYMLTPVE